MYCFRLYCFCQHVYSSLNVWESFCTNSSNGHSRFHLISKLIKLVWTQIRCVLPIYKESRTSSLRFQLEGMKVPLLTLEFVYAEVEGSKLLPERSFSVKIPDVTSQQNHCHMGFKIYNFLCGFVFYFHGPLTRLKKIEAEYHICLCLQS